MRYLVFAFDEFYPLGGIADVKLLTSNFEEATTKCQQILDEWDLDFIYIYDVESGKIIYNLSQKEIID